LSLAHGRSPLRDSTLRVSERMEAGRSGAEGRSELEPRCTLRERTRRLKAQLHRAEAEDRKCAGFSLDALHQPGMLCLGWVTVRLREINTL
jgi:hypothetical protein